MLNAVCCAYVKAYGGERFNRNGTPWDANLVVKRKLYPLLDSLGIERGGLLTFRHTSSTLMDRLGAPLKLRRQRLGRSDASLTLGVYTHVASEDECAFCGAVGRNLHATAPKKRTAQVWSTLSRSI